MERVKKEITFCDANRLVLRKEEENGKNKKSWMI